MNECRACGSVAQLYHVAGGRFRVSCSATDCNFHGKDGTIDDWCPGETEGPISGSKATAIKEWDDMQRRIHHDKIHNCYADMCGIDTGHMVGSETHG